MGSFNNLHHVIKNNIAINYFPFAERKQEELLTEKNIIKLAIDWE